MFALIYRYSNHPLVLRHHGLCHSVTFEINYSSSTLSDIHSRVLYVDMSYKCINCNLRCDASILDICSQGEAKTLFITLTLFFVIYTVVLSLCHMFSFLSVLIFLTALSLSLSLLDCVCVREALYLKH